MCDVEELFRRRREATLQHYRYLRGYYTPRDITPGASNPPKGRTLPLEDLFSHPVPGPAGQQLSGSRSAVAGLPPEGGPPAFDQDENPLASSTTEMSDDLQSDCQPPFSEVRPEVSFPSKALPQDEAASFRAETEADAATVQKSPSPFAGAPTLSPMTNAIDFALADDQSSFVGVHSAESKVGTMGCSILVTRQPPFAMPPVSSTTDGAGPHPHGAQSRFSEHLSVSTTAQTAEEGASDAPLSFSEEPSECPMTDVPSAEAFALEVPAEIVPSSQDQVAIDTSASRNDSQPNGQERPPSIGSDQTSSRREQATLRRPVDSAFEPVDADKRASRFSFHRLSQVFPFGDASKVAPSTAEAGSAEESSSRGPQILDSTKRANRRSVNRLSSIFTSAKENNAHVSEEQNSMADETPVLEDDRASTPVSPPTPIYNSYVPSSPEQPPSSEQPAPAAQADTTMPPPPLPKPSRLRSIRNSVVGIPSSLKQIAGKKRPRDEDGDEAMEDLQPILKAPRIAPQLPALYFTRSSGSSSAAAARPTAGPSTAGPTTAGPSTARARTARPSVRHPAQRYTSLMGVVNTSLREQQATGGNDPVWRPRSPAPSIAPARHDSADWTSEERREFGTFMRAAESKEWMMDLD